MGVDDGEGSAAESAAPGTESDPESRARSIALRLLAQSARTRSQLAQAMARRGVPEHVADGVLDRFTDVGLVDDAAYAEMVVRTRQLERGLARPALKAELARKGVTPQDSEAALSQIDPEAEDEAARRIVRKRLASMGGVDDLTRRRRLVGTLARKGHHPGRALRIVDEVLAESREDPVDPELADGPDWRDRG